MIIQLNIRESIGRGLEERIFWVCTNSFINKLLFHQIYVDCLSKRRELTSQWVDAMRYSNTQYALFFTKLNVCPDIDYKDLKEIADKTGIKQVLYFDYQNPFRSVEN